MISFNEKLYQKELHQLPLDTYLSSNGVEDVIIYRAPLGHLCGYVKWGLSLDDMTIDRADEIFSVRGGVTFFDRLPRVKDGCYYVGFDCAHLGDYTPLGGVSFSDERYRTISYVMEEALSLRHQIAEFKER